MSDVRLKALLDAVIDGDEELAALAASQALTQATAAGGTAEEVLNAISAAGERLGKMFAEGDCFLPELFAGAEAMNAAIAMVEPELVKGGVQSKGSVVIGTVEGDVHEIGKRIVCAMLSGAGYRVHDLGADVTAGQFVARVRELHPEIVAASAYITTTCQRLPEIDQALREAGLRQQVKYLIGGASVTDGMLAWAGADGYGENAAEAVNVVRSLVQALQGEPR